MTAATEERLQRLAQLDALLARAEELATAYGPGLTSLHGYMEAGRIEVAREIDRVHPARNGMPTTADSGQPAATAHLSILVG